VSFAGADLFWCAFDLCGAAVGDSDAVCSEEAGVSVERPDFFSRATITSCAGVFAAKITLQSTAHKNRFSMIPPDKRFSPFTSPRS
jgi:hypothetical protein